jgi:hypothetical protein
MTTHIMSLSLLLLLGATSAIHKASRVISRAEKFKSQLLAENQAEAA